MESVPLLERAGPGPVELLGEEAAKLAGISMVSVVWYCVLFIWLNVSQFHFNLVPSSLSLTPESAEKLNQHHPSSMGQFSGQLPDLYTTICEIRNLPISGPQIPPYPGSLANWKSVWETGFCGQEKWKRPSPDVSEEPSCLVQLLGKHVRYSFFGSPFPVWEVWILFCFKPTNAISERREGDRHGQGGGSPLAGDNSEGREVVTLWVIGLGRGRRSES